MPDPVRVVLFDDGRGRLAPLTDLRAPHDVRTGALTLRERVEHTPGAALAGLLPRPELAGLDSDEDRELRAGFDRLPGDAEVVLLNGRCPLPPTGLLAADGAHGAVWYEQESGDLVAARCRRGDVDRVLAGDAAADNAVTLPGHALLRTAIDWRRFRDACLDADLALLVESVRAAGAEPKLPGAVAFGSHPVAVHPDARVYPSVVLNAEDGPIVIDRGATIRPNAILIGPAYIGPGSTVLEQALVKAHTAIGPVCKVAGEVGGTIFQGYANKAHHGHLGDSWVGEWVNFGAGTTNSNLLNTYGEVPVQLEPGGGRVRSGQTYLGCTVGDHAKFAINTAIMTGAVVHTGAMWASPRAVKDAVRRFAWVTEEGERGFRIEKFLDIARTVMARRGIDLSPAYESRLRALHTP